MNILENTGRFQLQQSIRIGICIEDREMVQILGVDLEQLKVRGHSELEHFNTLIAHI